jgi:peptidoglycan/xylan/chitin deacetylase (PgdA/CDA1 family)
MRKLAGKIISKILLPFKLRARIAAVGESGEILSVFFHRPDIEEFEKWIKWCTNKGFEFISSLDLKNILDKGIKTGKKQIWLTFDDGWRNNYTEVLPILKKYNVPATIFVSTNLINDGVFWLELARLNQDILPIQANELKLKSEAERNKILDKLKQHPQFKQMDREFMTMEELSSINKSNLISIANHTHNHVICTNCTPAELHEEIELSEALLNEHSPGHISFFAYPNGDFNDNTQNYLKDKFDMIALVGNSNTNYKANKEAITRVCLGDKISMEENVFIMLGFKKKLFSALKRDNKYTN